MRARAASRCQKSMSSKIRFGHVLAGAEVCRSDLPWPLQCKFFRPQQIARWSFKSDKQCLACCDCIPHRHFAKIRHSASPRHCVQTAATACMSDLHAQLTMSCSMDDLIFTSRLTAKDQCLSLLAGMAVQILNAHSLCSG